jgi:hypothetical protein
VAPNTPCCCASSKAAHGRSRRHERRQAPSHGHVQLLKESRQ